MSLLGILVTLTFQLPCGFNREMNNNGKMFHEDCFESNIDFISVTVTGQLPYARQKFKVNLRKGRFIQYGKGQTVVW